MISKSGIFFAALTLGACVGAAVCGSSRKAYNAVCKCTQGVVDKAEEMLQKADNQVTEIESY